MQEIKRINGYLSLDNYFSNKLGKKYFTDKELIESGLVEFDYSDRFWILSDKGTKIALFKEQNNSYDEAYVELFAEEIAKIIGIKTAHYDLAIFRGRKGVISYNFINENDSYYSGYEIISKFVEETLEDNLELSDLYGVDSEEDPIYACEQLNNLEDIWAILEIIYKDNPNKEQIVFRIVDGLVDKLIFDIIAGNLDDHAENWGILNDNLAPVFDNGKILNIHSNLFLKDYFDSSSLENVNLRFTVDSSDCKKALEVLKYFLNISSSEYKDRIINKINVLKQNMEYIPNIIEKRTEQVMPDYLKQYFITTTLVNIDNIDEIVNNKTK